MLQIYFIGYVERLYRFSFSILVKFANCIKTFLV